MIKDIINKNENKQYNSDAIEHLKKYFPNCFNKANQFDLDKFKDIIGQNNIDTINEGYNLNFLGKNYARLIASTDTTTIIKPDIVHNLNDENKNSENIYISGDNIDSLKHLLKSYSNKIKCIYIDPPYNTGTDNFVYNDKFNFTIDDLQTKLSIGYEQAKKIIDFTKKGSSSHSAWLMFMAPRLQLARDLLTDDGVIFISIDDNEQANLKLLCDDVFGEENTEVMIWRKSGIGRDGKMKNTTTFRNDHEYIIVAYKLNKNLNKSYEKPEWANKYGNPDNDPRGNYKSGSLSRKEEASNPNSENYYSVTSPSGKVFIRQFEISKQEFEKLDADNRIYWGKNGDAVPALKVFEEEKRKVTTSSLIDNKTMTTTHGSKELEKILNMDNVGEDIRPKPSDLVLKLIQIGTNDNDIILDFFSGSGTTGHAVMQLNAEDGGNRKFILCQIEEQIPKNKPVYKSGYKTMDEIGIERIKRAAKKIKESNPLFNGDLGFKHYSLVELPENTINKLYEFNSNTILLDSTAIINDLGKDSILETWLVRDGYGFGAEISKIELNNYTAYYCNKHIYLIDTDFNEDSMCALIKKIGDEKDFNPETIVLFGYNFTFTQLEMIEKNIITLQNNDKNLNVNIDIRH